MVCAIAFALFILWKNLVSKIRKFLNQLNMNGGGKGGEEFRLPDKCACWRVVSCEEKVGPEVGSPRFCKTAGSSDDSFEFCVVKISYGLYHLKQKIVDGSSCIQNEKFYEIQKISKSHFLQIFRYVISLWLLDVIQRSGLPFGLGGHILEAVSCWMSCFSTFGTWRALVLLLRGAGISLLWREALRSIVSLIDS